jgi:hypothetical protein
MPLPTTSSATDYESHLYYYMQSGALSEAFSDVWGEFIDLTNGAGNDTPGVRWLAGEDLPIGAVRSMSDPPSFGDPDRMTSGNYYCGTADGGGVHTNGGVANKAAFLMVDGGSFNGYTVTGIGLDKTARIWYEVQTNLFTSGSDYADLYDDLRQACTNLTGTGGITSADCQEVTDAVSATAMNVPPTNCAATHAPLCAAGTPINLFFDDLENPYSGNWSHGALSGYDRWYYPQTPNDYDWDATYATSGVYNFWGVDQGSVGDTYMRMTGGVSLPAGAYLHFNHAYSFENGRDGGVLEYSTNGGASWNDAGSLSTYNGYDGALPTTYGNPLGGRSAFMNDSYGYISTRASLASLAGQTIRFRFRLGSDSIGPAYYGWFIDDVRIYTCPIIDYDHSTYLPIVTKNYGEALPSGIINGDFEAGHTGWTEYSSNPRDIIKTSFPGTVTAHSGIWAAWLGGAYNDISYIQQQVTVPTGAPYLAYYHWIASADYCGYDFGGVLINGSVVDVYGLCTSSSTGGWVRHTVYLGSYAGQSVTLQIRVETDSTYNSNLFVDDVTFTASAATGFAEPLAVDPASTAPRSGSHSPSTAFDHRLAPPIGEPTVVDELAPSGNKDQSAVH